MKSRILLYYTIVHCPYYYYLVLTYIFTDRVDYYKTQNITNNCTVFVQCICATFYEQLIEINFSLLILQCPYAAKK